MIDRIVVAYRSGWLLLIGVGTLIAACERVAPDAPAPVRPVRYEAVRAAGNETPAIFSGVARAEVETELSFKVAGNINLLPVRVGESLEPGQLVASLDPADYRVALQQAEAGMASARAELRNAEANYERVRSLYENRNASRSDLDNARAGAEAGRAQLRAASQQVEAARLKLSYTRLDAPLACRVAELFVDESQNVAAGRGIVQLNCGECAEVVADVPSQYIGRVAEGSPATVRIDALNDRQIEARVTEVAVATGRARATYPVTVALSDQCEDIRSGMAADVTVVLPDQADGSALVVPFVAVGEDSKGRYVFILEAVDDQVWRARRRGVVVGLPRAQGLTITSGLAEGELVATAGVRRLSDGQRVTLLAD